jgi:hypothetical protein
MKYHGSAEKKGASMTGGGVTPPAIFYKQASGNIFKDDVCTAFPPPRIFSSNIFPSQSWLFNFLEKLYGD